MIVTLFSVCWELGNVYYSTFNQKIAFNENLMTLHLDSMLQFVHIYLIKIYSCDQGNVHNILHW